MCSRKTFSAPPRSLPPLLSYGPTLPSPQARAERSDPPTARTLTFLHIPSQERHGARGACSRRSGPTVWGTLVAIAPYVAFSRKTCRTPCAAIRSPLRVKSSGVKTTAEGRVWAGTILGCTWPPTTERRTGTARVEGEDARRGTGVRAPNAHRLIGHQGMSIGRHVGAQRGPRVRHHLVVFEVHHSCSLPCLLLLDALESSAFLPQRRVHVSPGRRFS